MTTSAVYRKTEANGKGWRRVKLGEVARIVGGSTPDSGNPAFWHGSIVWVTPTDLGALRQEMFVRDSARKLTDAGFKSCGTELIPRGSIVMSSRAPIGHLAIADVSLCTNQGCKTFVPRESVDSWFLYFAVRQAVPMLREMGSGATFAEVSKTQLESFEITIPDIEQQQHIAARLREQLGEVEQARAAVAAQLQAAQNLPDACLRCAFEGEATTSWERRKLGEVAECVQNGIYKSAEHYGHGQPFVRMYNVSDETWELNLGQLARVTLDNRELEKFALRERDLLVSRVNSLELVGKCAWVGAEADGYVFENMLIRVRINETADSLFIAQQMMTRALKEQIQRVAKRAIGQASINSEDVRNLEFILPPLTKQRTIAARIRAEFEQAQSLHEQLAQKLAALEKLPATLLREAFSGKI